MYIYTYYIYKLTKYPYCNNTMNEVIPSNGGVDCNLTRGCRHNKLKCSRLNSGEEWNRCRQIYSNDLPITTGQWPPLGRSFAATNCQKKLGAQQSKYTLDNCWKQRLGVGKLEA